jgi:hypothetical protein
MHANTKNITMQSTQAAHARWTDPVASFSNPLNNVDNIEDGPPPLRLSSTTDTSSPSPTEVAADVASSMSRDGAILYYWRCGRGDLRSTDGAVRVQRVCGRSNAFNMVLALLDSVLVLRSDNFLNEISCDSDL